MLYPGKVVPKARTALVTGATDGLGLALATRLVSRGYRVVLHGRSQPKLDRTVDILSRSAPPGVDPPVTAHADFSSLAEVEQMVEAVRRRVNMLDVLVNNAGIAYSDDVRETSADGYELRFAVNFLAPFSLALRLLLPLTAGNGRGPARVINVASRHSLPSTSTMSCSTGATPARRPTGRANMRWSVLDLPWRDAWTRPR